jgi:hypothetical protein
VGALAEDVEDASPPYVKNAPMTEVKEGKRST